MTDFDHSVPARPFRRLRAAAALALAAGLVVAGCSADDEDAPVATPTPTPSSNVRVPEGITLTEGGTDLGFGETATVAYEASAKRSTVLELTVNGVKKGSLDDLRAYVLNDLAKASTVYYVSVTTKNVGTGDLGKTQVPVFALDPADTLIRQSTFVNTFKKCPSTPLPATFGPGAEQQTCLVFLIPDHGAMTGVSYRPVQEVAGIRWKGTIPAPNPEQGS